MEIVRPEFVPDADCDREAMVAMQRDIADAAVFADDHSVDPDRACESAPEAPAIAGIDQAFVDGRAVSAVVVCRGDEVLERVSAVVPTELPYIPGLLSFREGGPILAALERLETVPDLLLVDGSGRIHYRQAGLATHVGVTVDVPAVGVAKGLLCGHPSTSLDEPLAAGTRVPISADEEVEAPAGTHIGSAVQTRQFASDDRHVNPVFVSPGHRVGCETAVAIVQACCAGYKLPEPIRLADAHADEVREDLAE